MASTELVAMVAAGVGWVGVAILLLFWKSFVPAYLNKKGENLATHEDIDKLVAQVQTVTTATKKIEAQISNEVWDRQKQWELKRDSLFEVAKSMTEAIDALTELYSFYDTENKRGGEVPPNRQEKRLRLETSFNNAASKFDNAALLAGIICGKELQKATLELGQFLRNMGCLAPKGNVEIFEQNTKELVQKRHGVTMAIRKELGVEE